MKKSISKFFLFLTSLFLCSCDTTSVVRKNYLSSKYKLTSAATINGQINDSAYFKQLGIKKNYINEFDVNNSIIDFNVKVENQKAVGYGSYNIVFKDPSINKLESNFIYECNFTKVYGEKINLVENTNPAYFGDMYYRKPNWWIRVELKVPEITSDYIVLEFTYSEANEVPPEFSHKLW